MKKQMLASAVIFALSLSTAGYLHAQDVNGGTSPTQPCNQVNSNLACGQGSSVPATDPQGDATGETIAIGGTAYGSQTTEIGNGSTAGYASTVVGGAASALATNSDAGTNSPDYYGFGVAVGNGSQANGYGSTAVGGYAPVANGYASVAIGLHAQAGTQNVPGGDGDVAIGGHSSTAVSSGSQTSGNIAIGSSQGIVQGGQPMGYDTTLGETTANGGNSIALGTAARSSGQGSIAMGYQTSATGSLDVVIGNQATTIGNYGSTSVGAADLSQNKPHVTGQFGSTVGFAANAQGVGDTAMGAYANTGSPNTNVSDDSADSYRTAVGYKSSATGEAAVSLGTFNHADGAASVSIGYAASATGDNSLALGALSTDGGMANVVSFGSVGGERRLINIAAGIAGTDAVNVSQMNSALSPINASILTLQSGYTALNNSYNTLSTDYTNLSNQVTTDEGTSSAASAAAQATADQAETDAQGAQSSADGAQASADAAQSTANTALTTSNQNTVQIKALVDGKVGVCTVNNGALACQGASAKGNGAQAIGTGATASGDGAMAYGAGSNASTAGSVAMGQGSVASGTQAVAVGQGAMAVGNNSVAIGAGSVATRDNSVDVGGRQITSVAAGTEPTDAVNLSQLDAAQNNTTMAINSAMNQSYNWARQYAAQAAAQAMAIPSTPSLLPGQKWVGAAGGSYDGQSAVGIGFAYQIDSNWSIGGGASQAVGSSAPGGRHLAFKVQTGYTW